MTLKETPENLNPSGQIQGNLKPDGPTDWETLEQLQQAATRAATRAGQQILELGQQYLTAWSAAVAPALEAVRAATAPAETQQARHIDELVDHLSSATEHIDENEKEIEDLRARLQRAVVLPGDWREQILRLHEINLGYGQDVVDLIDSWLPKRAEDEGEWMWTPNCPRHDHHEAGQR